MKKIISKDIKTRSLIYSFLLFCIPLNILFSQNIIQDNQVDSLVYPIKKVVLGDYYNVDQIESVEVTNHRKQTKHILNKKELSEFKIVMKSSVSTGGLETKPGHIFIKVKFFNEENFSNDYIYVDGAINFDSGVNKYGERFAGTFRPIKNMNFEKY